MYLRKETQMGRVRKSQTLRIPEKGRHSLGATPPTLHVLTRSQLARGGCHLGPGPGALPLLSPLRNPPVKEEQENPIEDVSPQDLSECPQVCLARKPESRSLCGSTRPRGSLIPIDRKLCQPLPRPHLPAATATHPRPVPGFCSGPAHGRLPGGR